MSKDYGKEKCIDCDVEYKKLHPDLEFVRVGQRCPECSNKEAGRYAREKWIERLKRQSQIERK